MFASRYVFSSSLTLVLSPLLHMGTLPHLGRLRLSASTLILLTLLSRHELSAQPPDPATAQIGVEHPKSCDRSIFPCDRK